MIEVLVLPIPSSNFKLLTLKLSFFCNAHNRLSSTSVSTDTVIVIPGVSSFSSIIQYIDENNLRSMLEMHFGSGGKLMGICAGFQAFLDWSEEAPKARGLGFVKGGVVEGSSRFAKEIWPKMGFFDVNKVVGGRLVYFGRFYFNHRYVCVPDEAKDSLVLTSDYGALAGIVSSAKNLIGFQFHPERSGLAGLLLLRQLITEARS